MTHQKFKIRPFNISPSLKISSTDTSPLIIHGANQIKRDLACRLLIEGYSAQGIPCILFTDGNRFSGIAKPSISAENKSTKNKSAEKLNRGFPSTNITTEKLLEKDFFLSVDSLGADLIGATILCTVEEQQQLRSVFAIAREQQRELISFQNLQSIIAWIIQNKESLPSWHGEIKESVLNKIQEKLLLASRSIQQEHFGLDYFPLEQFYKKSYSDSGFVNIFNTQLTQKGIQFALLPTLAILKKIAESDIKDKKLSIILSEPRLSRNYPSQMLSSVLKLLSLKGVKVHFCYTDKQDADYRLLDLSKQVINSDAEEFFSSRSQLTPFNQNPIKRVSIQINRETQKQLTKSLISKVETRKQKEKKGIENLFQTVSQLFKKTLNLR